MCTNCMAVTCVDLCTENATFPQHFSIDTRDIKHTMDAGQKAESNPGRLPIFEIALSK